MCSLMLNTKASVLSRFRHKEESKWCLGPCAPSVEAVDCEIVKDLSVLYRKTIPLPCVGL